MVTRLIRAAQAMNTSNAIIARGPCLSKIFLTGIGVMQGEAPAHRWRMTSSTLNQSVFETQKHARETQIINHSPDEAETEDR